MGVIVLSLFAIFSMAAAGAQVHYWVAEPHLLHAVVGGFAVGVSLVCTAAMGALYGR